MLILTQKKNLRDLKLYFEAAICSSKTKKAVSINYTLRDFKINLEIIYVNIPQFIL